MGTFAHGFHAAGHHDASLTELNSLTRHHDRLHAGSAHFVDSGGGDGLGEAGAESYLAAGSLAHVGLEHGTEENLVDFLSVDA